MSKLFYDHLIQLDQIDLVIKQSVSSKEEQEELWQLVEDMIHHKVMHIILDELPREHHNEFLEEFTKAPHDEIHIHYLKDKTGKDIEEIIQKELQQLEEETLSELFATQKKAK
jgi:hypothetical protein